MGERVHGIIGRYPFNCIWPCRDSHIKRNCEINFYFKRWGAKILTASILLGIMILPTIMTISEDAIHNVPAEYREASLGLGLTKIEAVTSAVIPMAMPGY